MAKHPKHLWIAFIAVIVIVLLQNALILLARPSYTGHATVGNISLCINSPPVIDLSACPTNAFVFYNYICTVQASDIQQSAFNYTLTKLAGPTAGDPLFVLNNDTLKFNASPSQIGNYTLRFTVDDGTNCGISTASQELNLSINFSDGRPYLVKPIPNSTWDGDKLFVAYDLNDYFADPNNYPLAYMVFGNTNIRVDIIDGEAYFTSAVGWCGSENITYRATNPLNLSADSNIVTLTVHCVTPVQPPTPSPKASGGSNGGQKGGSNSGGGGGGSLSNSYSSSCVESYACFDWSTCQLTRAVDPKTGNSQTVRITGVFGSRELYVDESYKNDPDVFYQGYQYRQCIDTSRCTTNTRTYVRNCSWKPSCSDSIQNQGETGVDCGGPCAPCSTCTDGIQNGKEEGIDCGGPFCPACNTCTDGKIDGKEIGVDCGGPDCPVCATCFDGIKNGDELGVDCGGKYCKPCGETQLPAKIPFPWITVTLLLLVAILFVTIFFAAINRHIMSLIMKFLFRYKKTNRRIIIPTNLKDEIIKRLNALEQMIDKQPMLKSQEELARIIRDYFKEALHLDFEFTNEELIIALQQNKLDPLLSRVLQSFFTRISVIEFSGIAIQPVVLKALVQEMRSLVYQTAVLTVDDLQEREKDLALTEISKDAPVFDRNYLLLTQAHLCLQFGKYQLAAALYTVLGDWYVKAPAEDQIAIYPDLLRLYDEYTLAAKNLLG